MARPEHALFQTQDGSELQIVDISVYEQAGAKPPSLVISKGMKFIVRVKMSHTEVLGDVGAKVYVQLCVNEICSGTSRKEYEQSKTVTLIKDATEHNVIFGPMTATADGIFKFHLGAIVLNSEIAAYAEGPILFVIES